MRHLSLVSATAFLLVVGCDAHSSSQLPVASARSPLASPAKATAKVYWSLFYAGSNPQVEVAKRPLKSSSKVTDVNGNGANELVCANAMRFVGSELWIMNLSPCHSSDESIAQVYSLPLTSNSTPEKTFVLSGPMDADHMTFDASGNLWVPSPGNNSVYEYTGPFTSSRTLSPAVTLTLGLDSPQGLGFDSKGNLYVANTGETSGQDAVSVFKAPISNQQPYFLKGVIAPSGLIFDRNGNLYVSSNGTTGAIAEYAGNHLKAGSSPTVVDSAGLASGPYGADLNFDADGNLYDADCGGTPGIYSYPTAQKKFSSTLKPVFYTNQTISNIGCVWGIAVH